MALFAMGDTHLSFSTNKPMTIFGGRWRGYAANIEREWKTLISPEDTVVVPGDVSWGMTLEECLPDFRFLDTLPGKKIFLKGNHDYYWTSEPKVMKFFAERGLSTLSVLHMNAFRVEERFVLVGTRGWYSDGATLKGAHAGTDWDKLINREVLRLNASIEAGKKLMRPGDEMIAFFHFPPVFGGFICDEFVNALRSAGVCRAYYGHIHGVYNVPPCSVYNGVKFNICSADYLNFKPLKISEE